MDKFINGGSHQLPIFIMLDHSEVFNECVTRINQIINWKQKIIWVCAQLLKLEQFNINILEKSIQKGNEKTIYQPFEDRKSGPLLKTY